MRTEDLKKKSREIVKERLPGKAKIDGEVEGIVELAKQHAVDRKSAIRTRNTSDYGSLRELENIDLVVRVTRGKYHFKDGLRPLNSAFSQDGAAVIEARNFRAFMEQMNANAGARRTAFEISGTSNVEELMRLLENSHDNHKLYNKIVAELEKRHQTSREHPFGEMGWRRNSNFWYLSPTAVRLLSELPGLDLFVGPHNRRIVPGV